MSGRQSRALAFPDFADCFCARMPNRLPDRYPVTPRYELARRIPTVVATRGNERLLCTMEHDGPHAWPVLDLLEPLPDPYADAPDVPLAVVADTLAPAERDDPELSVVADDTIAVAQDEAGSTGQDAGAAEDAGVAPVAATDAAATQDDMVTAVVLDAPTDTIPAADEAVADSADAPVELQATDPDASAPLTVVESDDAEAGVDEPADDSTDVDLHDSELDASLIEQIAPSDSIEPPAADGVVADDTPAAAVPDDTASLIEAFFADTADDAAEAKLQELPADSDAGADAEDCALVAPADVPTEAAPPEVLAADAPEIPYKVDAPDEVANTDATVADAVALAAPDAAASDVQHAADDASPVVDADTADAAADDAAENEALAHAQGDERADADDPRSQEPRSGASE